jgi:hypothetical protein
MANLHRTDIIVLALFLTISLIIPGVIVLQHFVGLDTLALLKIKWGRTVIGVVFTLLASATCLLNFYLNIFEPWLHRRKHDGVEPIGQMSGLPIIGGFFIMFAAALMPSSIILGVYLFLLYAIDANGLPWFLVSFIRNGWQVS